MTAQESKAHAAARGGGLGLIHSKLARAPTAASSSSTPAARPAGGAGGAPGRSLHLSFFFLLVEIEAGNAAMACPLDLNTGVQVLRKISTAAGSPFALQSATRISAQPFLAVGCG